MGGVGEKDAAMTLLQEEFQDDNIFAKKRATQRMDIVAKSLRPERTRKELIPWINGTWHFCVEQTRNIEICM